MSANQPFYIQRQQRQAPDSGSHTQVQTPSDTATSAESGASTPILRLRGANPPSSNRVQWAENVIDNEGLGRKSSKVCCIYHAPRAVGESSDESSSDSSSTDSDSDSDGDATYDPRARALAQRRARDRQHRHGDGQHHPDHCDRGKRNHKVKSTRRPSPNAYEKQPRPRPPKGDDGGAGPSGAGASPKPGE
ncbi:phosphatase inhibitor-domain-containing protein [Xylaria nigripes]|nr:phosphatase inhibitor-domain-containing protein [Xylaria nigripes]